MVYEEKCLAFMLSVFMLMHSDDKHH